MKRLYLFSLLLFFSAVSLRAQEIDTEEDPDTAEVVLVPNHWIHVYRTDKGKTRVTTAPADSIKSITYGAASDGGYSKMFYKFVKQGDAKEESIDMSLIDSVEIGTNVPLLIINTDYYMKEISSKDYYTNMTFELKGYGLYKDVPPTAGTIKGRGNSSWVQFPKKPYRLKFPEKVKICGLKKAKNYVLLANYIDPTLLRNAIAFKVGEMLGMPYTNHSIPVNIIFNGINKGAYQLTEKIGFNKASLPISDEEGILFCLEQDNIDEEYNSSTYTYGVNFMVKAPDFKELASQPNITESPQEMWERWKKDFRTFESSIPSGKFTDYLDIESLVNYLFVYNLTGNGELNHPKSVYMYKEKADTTYKMGPIWDFDWAYTFGGNYQEGAQGYEDPLLDGNRPGYNFFRGMVMNSRPQFMAMYQEKWDAFKERLPELWAFIDEYAHAVKASAAQNGEVWPTDSYNSSNRGRNVGSTDIFPTHIKNLKIWLQGRIDYIESQRTRNFGLY